MRRFPSTKTAVQICTHRALQIRPWGRMHHLVPRERTASSRRMRVAAYELAGAARRYFRPDRALTSTTETHPMHCRRFENVSDLCMAPKERLIDRRSENM
ncbi:hypothetical protein ALC53_08562 [Atta colombica]|uniref:Uncharacterized protein n=1 Tax=Atta colombica TaxID=520822 RepID=A0A151I2G1_9HYME|nr:hypothetical protein ALC53_08562 [Atta colombica]